MNYPNSIYPQVYPQFPQQFPQFQQYSNQQPQQSQQTQQTQNAPLFQNALVSIPNEAEARNYPVGYGQSVSFRDENAPYLYTKTMGVSQLEPPKFEKYRIVKEEGSAPQEEASKEKAMDLSIYAEKSEIEALRGDFKALKEEVAKLKKKKREVIVDDDDE